MHFASINIQFYPFEVRINPIKIDKFIYYYAMNNTFGIMIKSIVVDACLGVFV